VPHKPKIVALLPVKNGCEHLRDVLTHLAQWVDAIIVLDNVPDDGTFGVSLSFPKVRYYQNDASEDRLDDSQLQSKLWRLAAAESPDWVLTINTDQMFEDRVINEIDLLLAQDDYDVVCFRVFHFWQSDTHYRIDGHWNPWKNFLPFMARYRPDLEKVDSFSNVYSFFSDIRIRHFVGDQDQDDTEISLEEWAPSKQLYFLKG
jgi:hypothetical protein